MFCKDCHAWWNKPGFRHFVEFFSRENRWFPVSSRFCLYVFSTRFHGLVAREVYESSNVVVHDVDVIAL